VENVFLKTTKLFVFARVKRAVCQNQHIQIAHALWTADLMQNAEETCRKDLKCATAIMGKLYIHAVPRSLLIVAAWLAALIPIL
jgi:hypothetical protein